MAVLSQHWDFGNGVTSSDASPLTTFDPGVYDVTLTVEDSDGETYVTTHKLYIRVNEDNQALISANYYNKPKCLHYGWLSGWSEYAGEHWVWPGTPASVTEFIKDDKMHTLVWDIKDNKRYAINVEETNTTDAVYKDKELYDIETILKLPEYTGEQQHYDVSHLETYLAFKPETLSSGLPAEFTIDVALITDVDQLPVEVQKKANYLREITFYYQNKQTKSTQSRQLQITTATSEYQLINYESYFKINDRFRTPSFSATSTPQAYFGGAINWYTKGLGYGYDRATGNQTTLDYTAIEGVDGASDSGALLNDPLVLNSSEIASGCVCLWYKTANKPVLSYNTGSEVFIDYGVNGDWTLGYFNGTIPNSSFILSTYEVFDVRVMDSTVTQDNLDNYFNNLSLYLPR